MESFPPPDPTTLVHQPDDAPFLQPDGGEGRSRWWLWGALGLVAVAAIVLGVVLFADSVGDGTHPEASSQSTIRRWIIFLSLCAASHPNRRSLSTGLEPPQKEFQS